MITRQFTWLLVGGVAALLTCALSGCARSANGAPGDSPLHLHVVCMSAENETDCPATDRAEAFDGWVQDVLYRPESSFSVRLVGTRRNASTPLFSVCVPRSWGPGDSVLGKKHKFVADSRALATARELPPKFDSGTLQGCNTPERDFPGEHRVVLIAPALDPAVVHALSDPAAGAHDPLHTSVICDRSDSGFGVVCDADALRHAYDAWLASGAGSAAGSSWTVHLVAKTTEAPQRIFQVVVPGNLNPGARVAYLLAARYELRDALPAKDTHNASALATAIQAAIAELHERPGRYSLIVLSDLREVDPTYNFERKAPKVEEFEQYLEKSALRADLHDTPVFACGLHDQGGSQGAHNPKLGEQVRNLWEAIFRSQGAAQVELRTSCDQAVVAQS